MRQRRGRRSASGCRRICASVATGHGRDEAGLFAQRYDATPGTAYLLRPDGYVAARFRHPTYGALDAALARAAAR